MCFIDISHSFVYSDEHLSTMYLFLKNLSFVVYFVEKCQTYMEFPGWFFTVSPFITQLAEEEPLSSIEEVVGMNRYTFTNEYTHTYVGVHKKKTSNSSTRQLGFLFEYDIIIHTLHKYSETTTFS